MTHFLRVDCVDDKGGESGPQLVNVDEIATVEASVARGAKSVIYLRNLRQLNVLQTFTWFESKLKTRVNG